MIPGLEPIEARTRASSAAELLREKILDGSLPPGTRLIEADIARQLRISRGPVREALAALRAEGLVHEEAPRGVSVAELTAKDIDEIYQVRASLESGAARLVIAADEPEARDRLVRALDQMRSAAAREDRVEFVEADLALHEELCRVSGNKRLLQAWEAQVGLLRTLIRMETVAGRASFGPLLEDHERFVARIVEGDAARATDECWELFKRSNAMLAATAAGFAAGAPTRSLTSGPPTNRPDEGGRNG